LTLSRARECIANRSRMSPGRPRRPINIFRVSLPDLSQSSSMQLFEEINASPGRVDRQCGGSIIAKNDFSIGVPRT